MAATPDYGIAHHMNHRVGLIVSHARKTPAASVLFGLAGYMTRPLLRETRPRIYIKMNVRIVS